MESIRFEIDPAQLTLLFVSLILLYSVLLSSTFHFFTRLYSSLLYISSLCSTLFCSNLSSTSPSAPHLPPPPHSLPQAVNISRLGSSSAPCSDSFSSSTLFKGKPVFHVDLPINLTHAEAKAQISQLQTRRWIDLQTRRVRPLPRASLTSDDREAWRRGEVWLEA